MAKKSAPVARRGTRKPAGATPGRPRARAAAGAAGKAALKKAPAKKSAAGKGVARKVVARKAPARKVPAKKIPLTKGGARKSTARKAAVKKAAVRKVPVARRAPGTAATKSVTAAARKPALARKVSTPRSTSARPRGATAPVATPRGARAGQAPPAGVWMETLRDGTRVLVRPITKKDAALERAFIKRLSPQSRRLRFLGQIGEPSDTLLRDLTDLDWRRDAAFIALVQRDGEEREIGVSRYGLGLDGSACECAVTVDDEWQGRGLAVILMRHLIELARSRGIGTMFSIDTAGNQRMRDLARYLGFECKPDPDEPGQVIHTLALAAR